MAFNTEQTEKQMMAAMQVVLAKEWPNVQSSMRKVIEEEREALAKISLAYISGSITEADVKRQLEDEREAFEAGLSMTKVVSTAAKQKAVNAALDVFWKAVSAALGR
ncbi:MAG: hypothetical protein M0R70_00640 [Nitrospirae bacterium]|nr:hypothetical protein [Nitrospirota bacterium]